MEKRSSRGNSGLSSVDSVDSLWVYRDDWSRTINDSEEEGGDGGAEYSPQLDSYDKDSSEHKLIRTEPKIDPFDVEALEVRGGQRNTFEGMSIPECQKLFPTAKPGGEPLPEGLL